MLSRKMVRNYRWNAPFLSLFFLWLLPRVGLDHFRCEELLDNSAILVLAILFCFRSSSIENVSAFQLMMNMLEHRDKLQEQLEASKKATEDATQKQREAERERDSLVRQLDMQTQHLPAVSLRLLEDWLTFQAIILTLQIWRRSNIENNYMAEQLRKKPQGNYGILLLMTSSKMIKVTMRSWK